ncbi:hypothetical protein [Variovorax saccharolyticus]|uniref:hypothetical protein n=1 Tax=Variovorax saccharolyticus TaxID=3053516 RepID=UPI002578A2E6|nr:hypothetical protein [Variovorax sp. J31P216]MDM0029912.1 hypothetical protein [Variovorax sp. J31P216]
MEVRIPSLNPFALFPFSIAGPPETFPRGPEQGQQRASSTDSAVPPPTEQELIPDKELIPDEALIPDEEPVRPKTFQPGAPSPARQDDGMKDALILNGRRQRTSIDIYSKRIIVYQNESKGFGPAEGLGPAAEFKRVEHWSTSSRKELKAMHVESKGTGPVEDSTPPEATLAASPTEWEVFRSESKNAGSAEDSTLTESTRAFTTTKTGDLHSKSQDSGLGENAKPTEATLAATTNELKPTLASKGPLSPYIPGKNSNWMKDLPGDKDPLPDPPELSAS